MHPRLGFPLVLPTCKDFTAGLRALLDGSAHRDTADFLKIHQDFCPDCRTLFYDALLLFEWSARYGAHDGASNPLNVA